MTQSTVGVRIRPQRKRGSIGTKAVEVRKGRKEERTEQQGNKSCSGSRNAGTTHGRRIVSH